MARGLSPGDIVQATMVIVDNEQVALPSFFYLCGIEAGAGASDADFAIAFDAAVGTDIKQVLNNNATYKGCTAQVVNPPPIAVRQRATINAGIGSAGATALPRQTAGLISWKTDLAGRPFRGRTFVPFPATFHDDTQGVPTALYQIKLGTLATAILGLVTIPGGGSIAVSLSVFHRRFNSTTPITSFVQSGMWATQKRRGSFGRANVPPF